MTETKKQHDSVTKFRQIMNDLQAKDLPKDEYVKLFQKSFEPVISASFTDENREVMLKIQLEIVKETLANIKMPPHNGYCNRIEDIQKHFPGFEGHIWMENVKRDKYLITAEWFGTDKEDLLEFSQSRPYKSHNWTCYLVEKSSTIKLSADVLLYDDIESTREYWDLVSQMDTKTALTCMQEDIAAFIWHKVTGGNIIKFLTYGPFVEHFKTKSLCIIPDVNRVLVFLYTLETSSGLSYYISGDEKNSKIIRVKKILEECTRDKAGWCHMLTKPNIIKWFFKLEKSDQKCLIDVYNMRRL
jgi:hypothetical protein